MVLVGRILHGCLVALIGLSLILPLPAWSAVVSAGTARGVRAVELTLDGGKSWLPLGATSMPVLDGTQIRSRNGGAVLDLADGSRLNVLPFSSVGFRQTGKVRRGLRQPRPRHVPAARRRRAWRSGPHPPGSSRRRIASRPGSCSSAVTGPMGVKMSQGNAAGRGARRRPAHDDGEPRAGVPAEASRDVGARSSPRMRRPRARPPARRRSSARRARASASSSRTSSSWSVPATRPT